MPGRPDVIAFDVIETLFPLEPLRGRLVDAGQPGHVLELWFARLLRDAFALAASDGYRPFGQIAAGALSSATGHTLSDDAIARVLAGFRELDPHPDVEPALRRAYDAGVQVVTVTNGSAELTEELLERAGVAGYVQRALSVDDVQRWKPAAAVYLHVAATCGVEPDRAALVAAHSWDIHGAHQAGLTTGWVSRLEKQRSDVFATPDATGDDLPTVVDRLLELRPAS